MKKSLLLLVSVLLIAAGCNSHKSDVEQNQQTTPPPASIPPASLTDKAQSDETVNWKVQSDSKAGWSFKNPTTWVVGGSFDAYNQPKLTVSTDYISRLPKVCELGLCQPNVNRLTKQIEEESIPGVVSFKSGKGVITTGATVEGAPPISPWYKLTFIKGDEYYTFQLTDYSTTFKTENEATAYLAQIHAPAKVTTGKYEVYNDFITLIQKTLVVE